MNLYFLYFLTFSKSLELEAEAEVEIGSDIEGPKCPSNCTCPTEKKVNCLGLDIEKMPEDLPQGLTYLNMAKNELTEFSAEFISEYSSTIKEIDFRNNRIQRVNFNSGFRFLNLTDIDFR